MTVPGSPQTVTVADQDDLVRVDWTAPAFTGGDRIALTSYRVELVTSVADVFATITCNEGQATLIAEANPSCTFPMLNLL